MGHNHQELKSALDKTNQTKRKSEEQVKSLQTESVALRAGTEELVNVIVACEAWEKAKCSAANIAAPVMDTAGQPASFWTPS